MRAAITDPTTCIACRSAQSCHQRSSPRRTRPAVVQVHAEELKAKLAGLQAKAEERRDKMNMEKCVLAD